MELTIVIPAHNEEETIEATIRDIAEKVGGMSYEILVVNDHSVDATVKKVLSLAGELNDKGVFLRLVSTDSSTNGFTEALHTGFIHAKGEFVIPVMADSCDDAYTINDMYIKAIDGYDIICGSRYMRGGKRVGGRFSQGFFSRAVGVTLRCLTGVPTWDSSNAFKMYRRSIFDFIEIERAGFAVSMQILLKGYFSGLRITEVSTGWRAREAGTSDFFFRSVMLDYFKWYFWALLKTPGFLFRKLVDSDIKKTQEKSLEDSVTYSRGLDMNEGIFKEDEETADNRR